VSEDKLLKARDLAAKANDLLQNEAYLRAVETVKNEIVTLWTNSKTADERERAWLAFNLVDKLSASIVSTYSNGKVADAELKKIVEKQERKKLFGVV